MTTYNCFWRAISVSKSFLQVSFSSKPRRFSRRSELQDSVAYLVAYLVASERVYDVTVRHAYTAVCRFQSRIMGRDPLNQDSTFPEIFARKTKWMDRFGPTRKNSQTSIPTLPIKLKSPVTAKPAGILVSFRVTQRRADLMSGDLVHFWKKNNFFKSVGPPRCFSST